MPTSPPIWETMHLNFCIRYGKKWNLQCADRVEWSAIILTNRSFFMASKRFPFDTKSPIRFSVAIVFQFVTTFSSMNILKCVFLIGTATLPMIFPMTDDIRCDLDAMQRLLTEKRNRKHVATSLKSMIQFHSDTRQLSLNFTHNTKFRELNCCLNTLFRHFSVQIDQEFLRFCATHADDFVRKCHCYDLQSDAIDQNENGNSFMDSSFYLVASICDFHSISSNRISIPWKWWRSCSNLRAHS